MKNKHVIPDFTSSEQHTVSQALLERYGKLVNLQLADSELQLDPASPQLTECPTLFWSERGADFVIWKVSADRYRCQFFYSANEQFGTGRDIYDNLAECTVNLLQVQADHQRIRRGMPADASRSGDAAGEEYSGPLVI